MVRSGGCVILPPFGHFFSSVARCHSLARVTHLAVTVFLSFRAVHNILDMDTKTDGKLRCDKKKSPKKKVFVSARYRVARASSPNRTVHIGGMVLQYPSLDPISATKVYFGRQAGWWS